MTLFVRHNISPVDYYRMVLSVSVLILVIVTHRLILHHGPVLRLAPVVILQLLFQVEAIFSSLIGVD